VTISRRSEFAPLLQAVGARVDGRTDGQLLEQFLARHDEAAFAALVRRHGPMVLGVCRRVLGNAADADDAFQATFLVLLRRASSLVGRAVVGAWLHGVARRTALKARVGCVRRRAKEQAGARPEAAGTAVRNDWLPLLDEELARLPEKYRLPIVLCDLEGRTRQEAAEALAWPEGTVAGRLARGRALLAKRLLRRAGTLAALLPAVLAAGMARAVLPPRLITATVQAAVFVSAGPITAQGAASVPALVLARGVTHAMLWNKVKIGILILVLAAGTAGAGGLAFRVLAADGPPRQSDGRPGLADGVLGEEKPPAPKSPPRTEEADPSLQERLAKLDALRNGPKTPFDEVEKQGKELLARYTQPEEQAKIYFMLAHVYGQSGIHLHPDRVTKYARLALRDEGDPLQRAWLHTYLGCAAEVDPDAGFRKSEDRRHRAATRYLEGYKELLALKLPDKPPELPQVRGVENSDPREQELARRKNEAAMRAWHQARYLQDLIAQRDILVRQIVELYRRPPAADAELEELAEHALGDGEVVAGLIARVRQK
jgi:RNA polymerase sigma factor (sigma-70 family)